MLESVVAYGIIAGARAITGLRSLWLGTTPIPKQRIYYCLLYTSDAADD